MLYKILKIITAFFLAYGLFFGFFLPWLSPIVLPKLLKENIGLNINLLETKFNPFTFELSLHKLQILDQAHATFLHIDDLALDVNPLALAKNELLIQEVSLINPEVFIRINTDGELNLMNILPKKDENQNPKEDSQGVDSKLYFILKYAEIKNGAIYFTDASNKEIFFTKLEKLNYSLQDLSTKPQKTAAHKFQANGSLFENVAWEGGVSLNPFRLYGEFLLDGLPLEPLWEYLAPKDLPYSLTNGKAWLKLPYQLFLKEGSLHVRLDKAWAEVNDFNFLQNGEPFTKLDNFTLKSNLFEADFKDNLSLNLDGLSLNSSNLNINLQPNLPYKFNLQKITLEEINAQYKDSNYSASLEGLSLSRFKGFLKSNKTPFAKFEEINISKTKLQPNSLLVETVKVDEPFLKSALDDNFVPDFLANLPQTQEDKNDSKPSWKITLNHFDIHNGGANISTKTQNHLLSSLHVKVADLSYPVSKKIPYTLNAKLDGASMDSAGSFLYDPMEWSGDFKISHPNLKHYNPYLKPFFLGKIHKGSLHVKGIGSFKDANWKVKSALGLSDFSLYGANDSQIMGIGDLKIASIDASPKALYFQNINIAKPYVNVHIYETMDTNLNELFVPTSNKPQNNHSNDASLALTIEGVALNKGVMDFADDSLPLPFKVRIEDLNGEFSSLETQNTKPARVRLEGQVEPHGYTKIEGEMFPLDPAQKLNIDILFKNIDMTRLSPYSGKFVGYALKEGKLDLDLGYLIENSKLKGENTIIMHDLTLGDVIESPDALNLPLHFAIALLKDNEGKIDINLPVSGDLNDPEFAYGALIFKAIGNLITGIVTSPFRFLGNMLGIDGEKLKSVEFEPGFANLLPPAKEKIANYTKILSKRPGIKLEITPTFHHDADTKALKKASLEEQLSGSTGVSYGKLLGILYAQSFSDKELEKLKDLHTKDGTLNIRVFEEAMYEALVKIQPLRENALNELAKERAKAIHDTLISAGVSKENLTISQEKEGELMQNRWIELPVKIVL